MEMEDLSAAGLARRKQAPAGKSINKSNGVPSNSNGEAEDAPGLRDSTTDSSIAVWTYATATWLIMMSIPFLAFPRFLLFLSSTSDPGEHREYKLTSLERFLLTQFAILALSLAIGIIISVPSDSLVTLPSQTPSHGHPLLVPVTFGLLISAFLSYNTPASQIGPLAFFTTLGMGTSGLLGIFALLFSGSSSSSRKIRDSKHRVRFLHWTWLAELLRKKGPKNDGNVYKL